MVRKKTTKTKSEVERQMHFKDAETQTLRYVDFMPLPIIVNIKLERESSEDEMNTDAFEYGDHQNNSDSDNDIDKEIVLHSLKIEINETNMTIEPDPAPLEEFQSQPNKKISPPVATKPPKKPPLTPSKEDSIGSKAKRVRKNKAKDPVQKRPKSKASLQQIDCKLCSFTCKRPSHLKRHMLMHTGEKPHKCEHCEKTFAQKTDLNRHIIIHAMHYNFHCTLCGRGFNDDESTKQHEQKCNTKRYFCDLCDYMTFSTGNLELHKRKHTGERPFACGNCDKRFTRVSHLNQHAKVHANDFEMHCSMCGRGFAESAELLKHEMKCKNRQFQCHMCRDVHNRMDNLRRHIKITHMGKKEVMCEFCSKQYPARSSLKKHIKSKHPERMTLFNAI